MGDTDLASFGPWYGCLDCDVDDFVNSINNIAEVVDAEKVEIAVSVIGGQSWEWKISWQVDSISVTDIFLYVQVKIKLVSEAEKDRVRGVLKLLILKELEKSDATGYELIQKISAKAKKPSPGSVYPLLKELANASFLNVRVEGNKKIYSLSEKGKAVLEEASKREKEAIMRKIEVLKASGIISEDEANKMFQFISMKRELWMKLHELRNWARFINLLAKAIEKSKSEVEEIVDETIKKLEELIKK